MNQAGDHGILVDQQRHAVYYATHVNETFYEFVRNLAGTMTRDSSSRRRRPRRSRSV